MRKQQGSVALAVAWVAPLKMLVATNWASSSLSLAFGPNYHEEIGYYKGGDARDATEGPLPLKAVYYTSRLAEWRLVFHTDREPRMINELASVSELNAAIPIWETAFEAAPVL